MGHGDIGSLEVIYAPGFARNERPDKLRGKVKRAEGREIGLDPRFGYFRFKSVKPAQAALLI